jgi:hypothetical protein
VKKPHVALCSISWDTVSPLFLSEWSSLIFDCLLAKMQGWEVELALHFSWGALLPVARDRVFLSIYNTMPDCTHVLLIDSDVVGLKQHHVQRLIEHDKPIVAPCVPMGQDPNNPACCFNDNWRAIEKELEKDDPGLVERRWVGTGCVLVKREVIDKTLKVLEKEDGSYGKTWFTMGRLLANNWDRRLQSTIRSGVERILEVMENENSNPGDFAPLIQEAWTEGFKAYHDGIPCGEDVDWGERALSQGFRSYIDCGIKLEHNVERTVSINEKCFTKRLSNDNQSVSVCSDNPGDSSPGVLDGDAGPVGAGKESVTVDG